MLATRLPRKHTALKLDLLVTEEFELLDDVELVVETFEVVEVFLSDSRPEEDHTGND